MPINVAISASLNLQPGACSIKLKETLTAQAILTAGNGSIGYYIEGGICCGCFIELCWRDEGNLYSWPGYSRTIDIVTATPLADQTIPLDTATVCPAVTSAPGQIDYPFDGETFNQNDRSFTKATFTIAYNSSGGPQTITLDNQVWTSSCPGDLIGATGGIWYGDCPTRTLKVVATSTTYPTAGSGTATVTVNVNPNPSSTAITPITLAPAVNQQFLTNCMGDASVIAMATYNNPDNDSTTLTWYSDSFFRHGLDPNNDRGDQLGTGLTAPLLLSGSMKIIRLIGVDVGGHTGLTEIPIIVSSGCPK